MGGNTKTSTLAVIIRGQPSPYLKSKVVTALAASPWLSGNLAWVISLLIPMLSCLISHVSVISPLFKERVVYSLALTMARVLEQKAAAVSYAH